MFVYLASLAAYVYGFLSVYRQAILGIIKLDDSEDPLPAGFVIACGSQAPLRALFHRKVNPDAEWHADSKSKTYPGRGRSTVPHVWCARYVGRCAVQELRG